MTRRESYRAGKVPLGTLRSDIDYGEATSHTTAGCIGIKVWVYRGDIVPLKAHPHEKAGPRRTVASVEAATTPAVD